MAATTVKDPVLQRADRAWKRRDQWNPILADTYAMCLPGGDPDGTRVEGAKTDVKTFDSTGVRGLRKRRVRMHGQLYPAFETIWDFELDGLPLANIPEGDQHDEAAAYLQSVAQKVFWAITNSNFHLEMPQAEGDAMISTGCIAVNPGSPMDQPLVFEALGIGTWAGEESPVTGAIEDVFRKRKPKRREVAVIWPDADMAAVDDWAKTLEEAPDDEVEVTECQVYLADKGQWQYVVYLREGEHKIVTRTSLSKPIIPFRMDKYTGEVLGRGPAMACRADMMTANKVVELVLKNATIAVTGMWQADDDGVLNPSNIKLVPGTIIPKAVGSAGLKALEMPGRFDVSQLVLSELRANIAETIEGPSLPPLEGDRRPAAEFWTRERERTAFEVPEHLRIYIEADRYLVRRVVDILSSPAFAGSPYHIQTYAVAGKELKAVPANPLIRMQKLQAARQRAQALAEAMQLDPDTTRGMVKMEATIRAHLVENGFPEDLLRSVDEQGRIKAMVEQAFQAGMMQGAQGAAKMAASEPGNQMLQTASQALEGADG